MRRRITAATTTTATPTTAAMTTCATTGPSVAGPPEKREPVEGRSAFEEQAERSPDQVALVVNDQRLTYAELDARTNQLARHLIQLGVGPEMLVGVFMERSVDAVVGIIYESFATEPVSSRLRPT